MELRQDLLDVKVRSATTTFRGNLNLNDRFPIAEHVQGTDHRACGTAVQGPRTRVDNVFLLYFNPSSLLFSCLKFDRKDRFKKCGFVRRPR